MATNITATLFSIDTGSERIEYLPWWEKHSDLVMRALLDNEYAVHEHAKALPEADRFLLTFVLHNAVFRIHDPLLYGPVIVFYAENLPRLLDRTPGRKTIELLPPYDGNGPLYALIERLIAGRRDVHIATKRPRGRPLRFRYAFPAAALALYGVESVLGSLARIGKRRGVPRTTILSNYRHYARADEENVFWGNVIRLLRPRTDTGIIYYNQVLPVQRTYPVRMLFDRRHRYLTEWLTIGGFSATRVYRRLPIPHTFSYRYRGVEYGDLLLPLVQAFHRIFYPFVLKQRAALVGLLAERPRVTLVDSELSLIGFQLGYLGGTRRIVFSNEIISEQYAMPPYVLGRSRPQFDRKLVNGERERQILARRFRYPPQRMVVFPDPRYLDGLLRAPPRRQVLLFISQGTSEQAAALFKALGTAPSAVPVVVKPHPLEDKDALHASVRGRAALFEGGRLPFTPAYALTHSSTLGLELLFQGTIVFLMSDVVFDIVRAVPYLLVRDPQEALRKMALLERQPERAAALRKRIQRYLARRYGLRSASSSRAVLETILR